MPSPTTAPPTATDLLKMIGLQHVRQLKRAVNGGVSVHAPVFDTLPIVMAAMCGAPASCRVLIEAGALERDPRVGVRALQEAAVRGHDGVAALLLAHGVPPDACDPQWVCTALMAAARYHHVETCRVLLDAGADPNRTTADDAGRTALHWAVGLEARAALTCRVLLEHGADPNRVDSGGKTPLILLADRTPSGRLPQGWEVARALLKHGASLEHRTPTGRTAISAAPPELAVLLQGAGRAAADQHTLRRSVQSDASDGSALVAASARRRPKM